MTVDSNSRVFPLKSENTHFRVTTESLASVSNLADDGITPMTSLLSRILPVSARHGSL